MSTLELSGDISDSRDLSTLGAGCRLMSLPGPDITFRFCPKSWADAFGTTERIRSAASANAKVERTEFMRQAENCGCLSGHCRTSKR